MSSIYNKIFFDFDSTLIKGESLDMLAEIKGIEDKVKGITKLTMSGEVSFEETFSYKMNLIAPKAEELKMVASGLVNQLVDDSKEVIEALKFLNKEVFILTSNFYDMVMPVASKLGINKDHIIANELYFNAIGEYTGFNQDSLLCKDGGKGLAIKDYLKPEDKSVFVGDGATDLATQEFVSIFIGFGGVEIREKVKKTANQYIDTSSMAPVLNLILNENELYVLANNGFNELVNRAQTTTTTTT